MQYRTAASNSDLRRPRKCQRSAPGVHSAAASLELILGAGLGHIRFGECADQAKERLMLRAAPSKAQEGSDVHLT